MELDPFGLPRGADFNKRPARARITGRRVVALVAVIVGSVLAALVASFAPDLENMLRANQRQEANQQVGALLRAGRDAQLRGDWPRALAAWDRLAKIMPQSADPHILRSEVLSRMNRHREAAAACTEGLARDPENPLLLNNRAYFRALARIDLKEALEDIEKALAATKTASYLDTRAYVRYLLGEFPGAKDDYDAALARLSKGEDGRERSESLGEIHFHRGLLRKATGDSAGMKADFAAARKLGFRWTEEPPPVVGPERK